MCINEMNTKTMTVIKVHGVPLKFEGEKTSKVTIYEEPSIICFSRTVWVWLTDNVHGNTSKQPHKRPHSLIKILRTLGSFTSETGKRSNREKKKQLEH